MQYVLNEEEYQKYQALKEQLEELPSVKELQKFCTEVANNMPVKEGWYKGRIWGCILDRSDEGYCDDCPARKVCPYDYKEYSK